MSSARRKAITKALYAEGYEAYHAGKSLQSNPHRYMDRAHWSDGWKSAETEAHARVTDDLPCGINCPHIEACTKLGRCGHSCS